MPIKVTGKPDGKGVTIDVTFDETAKETPMMFLSASSGGWADAGVKDKSGAPLRVNVMVGHRKADVPKKK